MESERKASWCPDSSKQEMAVPTGLEMKLGRVAAAYAPSQKSSPRAVEVDSQALPQAGAAEEPGGSFPGSDGEGAR